MRLLRHIIVKEISNTLDHTTLFRSNSLSTKMMTAYSKLVSPLPSPLMDIVWC